VLITAALMARYGPAIGLRLMIAPVGGAALTLATLALLGVAANLFNILALLLVLGMGVDYAVFMREGRSARATVIMAILLAGLMTLLSFGLLALSATPFIRSLGLTVALGVTFTFVLALLFSSAAGDGGAPDAGTRTG
jgi:predicted exporter